MVALFRPLHAELRAGQVYTLLALLYALWLYGYTAGRDRLCGAALAGLALAKLAGWPLWLLMLEARRWRALVWAIAVGAGAALLTLPLLGLDFWLLYLLRQAPAIPADPESAVPAFQTLTSLLRQLLVYDARWSPGPLLDAPWLASLLWWAIAAALVGVTLRQAQAARGRARAGMAMLCLVVPLQPAGEEYHYTLLLLVVVVLTALAPWPLPPLRRVRGRIDQRYALRALALPGLACTLLVLPAYFLASEAWAGWPRALLAYPRLYGALLLWGALSWAFLAPPLSEA